MRELMIILLDKVHFLRIEADLYSVSSFNFSIWATVEETDHCQASSLEEWDSFIHKPPFELGSISFKAGSKATFGLSTVLLRTFFEA